MKRLSGDIGVELFYNAVGEGLLGDATGEGGLNDGPEEGAYEIAREAGDDGAEIFEELAFAVECCHRRAPSGGRCIFANINEGSIRRKGGGSREVLRPGCTQAQDREGRCFVATTFPIQGSCRHAQECPLRESRTPELQMRATPHHGSS